MKKDYSGPNAMAYSFANAICKTAKSVPRPDTVIFTDFQLDDFPQAGAQFCMTVSEYLENACIILADAAGEEIARFVNGSVLSL